VLLFLHCWLASAGGLVCGVTINTNLTHSCLRVRRGLCWCQCVLFSEKRLKLVTVNRRQCDRHLFWSVDIVSYWYTNSISTLFLNVCPMRRSISTVDRFIFVSTCMVDIDQFLDRTNRRYRPYGSNQPSISTVILRRWNRTVEPNWPSISTVTNRRSIKVNRPNRRHLCKIWLWDPQFVTEICRATIPVIFSRFFENSLRFENLFKTKARFVTPSTPLNFLFSKISFSLVNKEFPCWNWTSSCLKIPCILKIFSKPRRVLLLSPRN